MMNQLPDIESIIKKPAPDFTRLHNVLTGEDRPDFIPLYELYLDVATMERMLGKRLPDPAATVEGYFKAGYDYTPVWPSIPMQLGDLVDTTSCYPIKNAADFDRYRWPTHADINIAAFDKVAAVLPQGMKIIGQTGGMFEMLQSLVGYNDMCVMLYDEPELIDRILQRVWAAYDHAYRLMAQHPQVGAIVISDDLGYKSQTLISPEHMRKYILPYHKALAEIAHRYEKPCILHSCGNLRDIMADIIDVVGIDAKHSYEDQIMPVTEAAELYGDRIAILGGIDVDRLCRESPQQIAAYTRMLLTTLGANGRYAAGSGNSIAHYVPLENYYAMLNEVWQLRS